MDSVAIVKTEIRRAMQATKCHRCGCFQAAVRGFDGSATLKAHMPGLVEAALGLFEPKRYDCLGCEICWPAVASNAAAEIDPALADGDHCATAEPLARNGWPPLPGDYRVLRFRAPVAVCTLNSDELVARLAEARLPALAIVGSLHTENLGIEHIIRNLLPNANVRFLVVCGVDARGAVGHLPGQSLLGLMRDGMEENGRIRGAAGKRPVIKNVSHEDVATFRRRIQVIDVIGETDAETIAGRVAEAAARDPGPDEEAGIDASRVPVVQAMEPEHLISDPAGYLVLYPDRRSGRLVVEHYSSAGVMTHVFDGTTATALYSAVIEAGVISRLDHAAYLGRELARAEAALRAGSDYVQDKAPGMRDDESLPSRDRPCCGGTSACHP
ncbi:MAG: DUF4346 domain-containing protein [Candidatus Accumulibacter sp.]|nr:DUF4346 domain-containing protein [Accumulibacter sp.]